MKPSFSIKYLGYAIERLNTLKEQILDEIDGGEECRGRDSQLTSWADEIKASISGLLVAMPKRRKTKK